MRGCAPQLPPRPGAAARFASRPERPASRLPTQPRPLRPICTVFADPVRSGEASVSLKMTSRLPPEGSLSRSWPRLPASESPLYPITAKPRGDLGRGPPPGGRISTKIYNGAENIWTKRTGTMQVLEGWIREWVTRGQKGRGCVGNQPVGRSGREAKRAAAPGLGGSCGARPCTHLRHKAPDLERSLDRALDARAPKSQAKVSNGADTGQDPLRGSGGQVARTS